MKCEGCPFDVFIYPENCCATGDATEPLPDCHLTPSDIAAIRKAVAGEGRLWCVSKEREIFIRRYANAHQGWGNRGDK